MIQYHPDGTDPFPYEDGQLLKIVRGGFAGKILRVNTRHSFWGDNDEWEVVLDAEYNGEWLYFIREGLSKVRFYTKEVQS